MFSLVCVCSRGWVGMLGPRSLPRGGVCMPEGGAGGTQRRGRGYTRGWGWVYQMGGQVYQRVGVNMYTHSLDMGPGIPTPPPSLLTPSSSHHNMYRWQASCTHPTEMLSCIYIIAQFYRPQTKFAKVMFSQVSVCPQRQGVYPIACWDTHTPWGRHPLLGRHPPLGSACWDTVNKRAVRIPLDCILVSFFLHNWN